MQDAHKENFKTQRHRKRHEEIERHAIFLGRLSINTIKVFIQLS